MYVAIEYELEDECIFRGVETKGRVSSHWLLHLSLRIYKGQIWQLEIPGQTL
jgi:hypothetical protein